MQTPAKGVIDYQALLRLAAQSPEGTIKFLSEELPFLWRDAYIEMRSHPVNIVRWQYGSFEYIFDDYASLESRGTVPYAADVEGRLIGVLGCSNPKTTRRDDYRLKGLAL